MEKTSINHLKITSEENIDETDLLETIKANGHSKPNLHKIHDKLYYLVCANYDYVHKLLVNMYDHEKYHLQPALSFGDEALAQYAVIDNIDPNDIEGAAEAAEVMMQRNRPRTGISARRPSNVIDSALKKAKEKDKERMELLKKGPIKLTGKEIITTLMNISLIKIISIDIISEKRLFFKFVGSYKHVADDFPKLRYIFGKKAKPYLEKRGYHLLVKIPKMIIISKPLIEYFEGFGDLVRFQPIQKEDGLYVSLGFEKLEDALNLKQSYVGDVFRCGEDVSCELLFSVKEDHYELQQVMNMEVERAANERKTKSKTSKRKTKVIEDDSNAKKEINKEERIIKKADQNCSQYNYIVTLPKHIGREQLSQSLINVGRVISYSEGYDIFFGRYALTYISNVDNLDALCNFDFGLMFFEKFTGLVVESLEMGRLRQKQLKQGKTTITVKMKNDLVKSRKSVHKYYRQFGRILFIDYDGIDTAEIMFYQELAAKLALKSHSEDFEIIPNVSN